jgi:hypothetical protein
MYCAKHLILWKFGSVTLEDRLNFRNIPSNNLKSLQYLQNPGLFSNMPDGYLVYQPIASQSCRFLLCDSRFSASSSSVQPVFADSCYCHMARSPQHKPEGLSLTQHHVCFTALSSFPYIFLRPLLSQPLFHSVGPGSADLALD